MSRNLDGPRTRAATCALDARGGSCGRHCFGPPCFRCLRRTFDAAGAAAMIDAAAVAVEPLGPAPAFTGAARHDSSR